VRGSKTTTPECVGQTCTHILLEHAWYFCDGITDGA